MARAISNLLVLRQTVELNRRFSDRDIERCTAGADDNLQERLFAPQAGKLVPQPALRSTVQLIPAIEQKHQPAVRCQQAEIVVRYISEPK
jgi:hypothetical protein